MHLEFNPEANHTLFTPTVSVDTTSSGMARVLSCIAGKSAEKVGTILPLSYQPLCIQIGLKMQAWKFHMNAMQDYIC